MLTSDGGARPLGEALARLDQLVESFETDPDLAVQGRALELLQCVDAVHRPGLTRLAAYLSDPSGEGRERLLADPAVRLLLELYDVLPSEASPRNVGFVPLAEVRLPAASGRASRP